jgi:hypothetical protein
MMLRRSSLLATACLAGLTLGVLPVSAQTQNNASALIQPKGGWSVSRIDNSATQGGAYCTLARQYQNGVIFSIGRNKAEEYSLAIDFQEARLNTDTAYDITLKAGNQARQLQMMPVSPRAIVVRLGWDDSFFAAMEKAQSFSASIDKEAFTLALPDYGKGKMDLAQCMDALKENAPAPQANTDILSAEAGSVDGFQAERTARADTAASTPDMAAVKKADEKPSVQSAVSEKTEPALDPADKRPETTRITQLETPAVMRRASEDRAAYVAPMRSRDIATLEEENERLKRQLSEQRRGYEEKLAQGSSRGNRIAELEEKLRLAELRGGAVPVSETPAVSVPQIKEVIKEVEVVKPDPAQTQKIAVLESEIADLRRQLSARVSAPAAPTEMKAAPTPLPDPKQAKHITALQEEVQTLKQRLAAQEAKKPDKDPAETRALQAALAERNQEIADLQTRLAALSDKAREATADDKETAMLRRELQQKTEQMRAMQQRTNAQQREFAQMKQQLAQVQRAERTAVASSSVVQRRTPTPSPSSAAPAAGGSGLQSLLTRAGISATQSRGANGASEVWQWRSGPLAGRAEAYQGRGNAVDVSQAYANSQRNACTGDFAAVPGPAQSGRVALDLACVESNGNTRTQSTLFAEQGGQVLALILEAPAEEMDRAMDARDRLGGQL